MNMRDASYVNYHCCTGMVTTQADIRSLTSHRHGRVAASDADFQSRAS